MAQGWFTSRVSGSRSGFGLRVTVNLVWVPGVGWLAKPQHFVSNCNQVPRPRVVLLCIFMASRCNKPTVAPPAYPGYANHTTRKRRLQRKHTAASYRFLKAKLLQCLQPMPCPALYSADLEEFRSALYTDNE